MQSSPEPEQPRTRVPGWAAMAARPPTGPRSRRPTRARLLSPPPNKTVQPFAAPQPNAQLPTPHPFPAHSSGRLGPSGQAAPLVSSPIFPNAIKWSEENLLAVAAGHLVTILNPACLTGPRGFVSPSQSPPFNVGAVHKDDLKSPLLLPFTLARDVRICVRSIAWSPRGMAPNGGCLLAVCTTDYRVKLYRSPHQEFRPEWVEVLDLSQLLYDFCTENDFGEREKSIVDLTTNQGSTHFDRKECRDIVLFEQPSQLDAVQNLSSDCGEFLSPCQKIDLNCSHMTRVGRGLNNAAGKVSRLKNRSTPSKKCILKSAWNVFKLKKLSREPLTDQVLEDYLKAFHDHSNASKDFKPPVGKRLKKSSKMSTQVTNAQQLISASRFVSRSYMLASMVLEWSSECMMISQTGELIRCAFLAAGTKAGRIAFWCVPRSQSYCVGGPLPPVAAKFLGFLNAHESWVSAISWSDIIKPDHSGSMCRSSGKVLLLATGDSSGSVKLWSGQVQSLMEVSETRMSLPWTLLMKVAGPDYIAVSSLALNVPFGNTHAILAIGKVSGCVVVWEGNGLGISGQMACQPRAHKQVVTGLAWTFDGKYLYSCAQDDKLQGWGFDGKSLWPLEHPDCLQLLGGEVNIDVPSSALEFFYGVALSSGSLALSTVRSIASGVVDPMYQSRTQKGMVQIIWIGGQQYSKVEMPLNDITPIWISRTALAFKQIQFLEQAFILWDVFCVLAFLKFSDLHILKPFIVQFIPNYDPIKWDQEIRNTLAYLSCRQLQILTVLYRRVLLPNVTTEIVLDEAQLMDKADPNVMEYQRRMEQLWWIEHELRQRLVLVFLLAFKNYRGNMEGKFRFLHILSYWVKTNRSKMCPQLVEADWSCDIPVQEFCSYCRCPIPFTSIEMAYCCGKEPFISTAVHKLQRCGVSMQVCGNQPVWVCSCCQRKVSQLAPSCFFSLTLRSDIEHAILTPQTCSEVEPRCPFCGILMSRFLSEFFLTPLAV